MSGYYCKIKSLDNIKHGHLAIQYKKNKWIVYCDPRGIGKFKLIKKSKLPEIENANLYKDVNYLGLGPDAIGIWINSNRGYQTLTECLRDCSPKQKIKNTLLDQTIIAGIGNIYANEILYRVGISPFRMVGELKPAEVKKLAEYIPMVLIASIRAGGSTIEGSNKYRSVNNKQGGFSKYFEVYAKDKKLCRLCGNFGNHKIKRVVQNGRPTFYCPRHQK